MTKNVWSVTAAHEFSGIDRRTLMRWGLATAAMSILPLRANANESAGVRNALAQSIGATGPQQHYDLTIGETRVNFSGKSATAVTVNGTVPGPLLHFREGDTVSIAVTNTLREVTSVHWHGFLIPNAMDGVPGFTFPGIHQGETFTYQFKLRQNGTYWYHSHATLQEPAGFYAPIIIDAAKPEPFQYEREYVVLLSDWNDTPPEKVLANLKKVDGYYNYRRQTLLDLRKQLNAATSDEARAAIWRERLMWAQMRMDPTDAADGGPEWQFLMHGQRSEDNWTALFNPGERVRLRIINGAAMNFFDFSIPGLPMKVVAADGLHVQPIEVNELRIGNGETYDVIVEPKERKAYTLFAATAARIGYARGTLAPEIGMEAAIPELGPPPLRTMAEMSGAHNHSGHTASAEHDHSTATSTEHNHHVMVMPNGETMDEADMAGMSMPEQEPTKQSNPQAESAPAIPIAKLRYSDLRALTPSSDKRTPTKTIEMKLTGDMNRYFWSINGKKMSESTFFEAKRGERLRFVLTNTTMMEHPMHLHGAFFEVDNGQGEYAPRKHTMIVNPGQSVTLLTSFDETGVWMFHCHLFYHASAGMMQAVVVTEGVPA